MPLSNGKMLRKIKIETTTAADASAISGVTASVYLARRDAIITQKLLTVSANTC